MTTSISPVLDLTNLLPGFSDPTIESQSCFREIMNATARPGIIVEFRTSPLPPQGLNKAAGAYLLTLADNDTSLWLDPSLRNKDIEGWLRFHTGAPFTQEPNEAILALIADLEIAQNLAHFNQGDAKYPDLATTVLVLVPSLTGGQALTLMGPGIEDKATIAPIGLSEVFWQNRAELVAHFQFGIDLILCADDQLISIPRTTRVTI